MAINPLNFLKEIVESERVTLEVAQHGLNYSKVGDCLDWDDWQDLTKAESREQLVARAKALIPKYELRWKELGEPATAEAWHAEEWGPNRALREAAAKYRDTMSNDDLSAPRNQPDIVVGG